EAAQARYLNYALSVITARALPDVRDGLKPVHRRVLIAMRDLNLTHRAKYRKCAKVVGDCMGNYHPHGDAAIYDTLVRMAQPWSMRNLLVDGQGNFGSIDGDPAAAMRYTEARMSRITEEMLEDLDKETVDYVPNYDETTTEPTVLPCKFPNLLINGSTGIAVGMATNIPPHNLKDICTALIKLCDNPEVSNDELIKIVKGPDFPTGGLICGQSGIYQAYRTGRGRVTVRGHCHIETTSKKDRQRIVVTEIPYQVSKVRIIESIANAVKSGNIAGISALHDYSGRDGINLCVELKKGEDPDIVLNQLYKQTPLQSTFSIINIALVNGRPRTLGLKEMLECFRDHRFEVIRRRTLYLLNKALDRAHILEGLLKAIEFIDEVIAIIRAAKDVPTAKAKLMERFELSDRQAQAILDMPLRRLTGLERETLQKEFDDLQKAIAQYRAILADAALVYDIIREDAYEMIDRYGEDRRTRITGAAEDITIEDLIAEEEMAVMISHGGYIKRMPVDNYRKQGRGGKGITGIKVKDDDFTEHFFVASTHDYILFFTDQGQVYWLKVYDIPVMGRAAKGRALVNVLSIGSEEKITSMIPVREFDDTRFLVMATDQGIIKKTALSAFGRPMKGGIRAINLNEGEELIGVVLTNGDQNLVLASQKGQACRFRETDVRAMGRPARGVAGIKLAKDDRVVSLLAETPNAAILTVSEKGLGKRSDFDNYRLTKRGAKGVVNMKLTEKTGDVISVMSISEEDDVMIMTCEGMVVRTAVKGIRIIGRATQGVRVITLNEDDTVSAVARFIGGRESKTDRVEKGDEEHEETPAEDYEEIEAEAPEEEDSDEPEDDESDEDDKEEE
ncbi:MAG: DNA gyrase subunit A, partial [Planctomycetes bacterium]|nr:DNA gyrase subunit A [Planctomycetota bacterium]